jgi:hypothetical protein
MNVNKTTPTALRELIRTFDAIRLLQQRLRGVLDAKIAAMRSADVTALEAAGHDADELLPLLQEKEPVRAGLMQVLARELGLPAQAARGVSVSQLAERLPAVERELLLHSAARLQEVLVQTARANRLAATIARHVTEHMKQVFSALRPARNPATGYDVRGESFAVGPAIVDTVG